MDPLGFVDAHVRDLRARGLFRPFQVLQTPQGPRIRIAGRELINMSSNDYLGLANHPALREAAKAGADAWGSGAGRRAHHCRHAGRARGAGSRACRLEGRGSHPGLPVGLRGQPGHDSGLGGPRRRDPQRRTEPRQHHRRLPTQPGGNPPFRPRGRRFAARATNRLRPRPAQAGGYGRRVQHGRRHRAAARYLRGGRIVRRHGDGGRRAWQRRVGSRRTRQCGPLWPARARTRAARHALEGHRVDGRLHRR